MKQLSQTQQHYGTWSRARFGNRSVTSFSVIMADSLALALKKEFRRPTKNSHSLLYILYTYCVSRKNGSGINNWYPRNWNAPNENRRWSIICLFAMVRSNSSFWHSVAQYKVHAFFIINMNWLIHIQNFVTFYRIYNFYYSSHENTLQFTLRK